MDIIEDKQQLLNLHHYEIYFIYSENDADLYKQIIKKMNSLPSIKRGIFHFNAIKRGEQSFEKLPDLLQKQLEQKNVCSPERARRSQGNDRNKGIPV